MNPYLKNMAVRSNIHEHLGTLRGLAVQCKVVVELGTAMGRSASALLAGNNDLHSYDIVAVSIAKHILRAHPDRFFFHHEDSLKANIPKCDLLFIDSLHTYAQLSKELQRHEKKVSRWIALLHTVTYGEKGESGKKGLQDAIDEFVGEDWRVILHLANCNGLTILERTMPRNTPRINETK